MRQVNLHKEEDVYVDAAQQKVFISMFLTYFI